MTTHVSTTAHTTFTYRDLRVAGGIGAWTVTFTLTWRGEDYAVTYTREEERDWTDEDTSITFDDVDLADEDNWIETGNGMTLTPAIIEFLGEYGELYSFEEWIYDTFIGPIEQASYKAMQRAISEAQGTSGEKDWSDD